MRKFLQIFFITLGVIFFIIIIGGIYLYVADPYGIKPIINNLTGQSTPAEEPGDNNDAINNVDKNPLLSPAQEQALEKIGIDPEALPSAITPAMEECFYTKLGATRANEIKNGSEPTPADYFSVRSCIQ